MGLMIYLYSDISTHAPLAGRDLSVPAFASSDTISTHAPLAGRDRSAGGNVRINGNFNPRAPCGARLCELKKKHACLLFQPTRPLRGATICTFCRLPTQVNFNPRAPCGARQPDLRTVSVRSIFQPTRPLRGATAKVYKSLCTFLR